ncbi:MAG: minichromosome maintenance protein MCM [Candidatus Helarchaeota archaeon]|nr:minichromosome maintenance protein MCM [Candidatus Helarchaeota archaeon]
METEEDYDPIARYEEFFKDFINEQGQTKYRDIIEHMPDTGEKSLIINFDDVLNFAGEPLAKRTLQTPVEHMKAAAQAIQNIIELKDRDYAANTFHARYINLPEAQRVHLRKIRANHIGKLIAVNGILTRTSEVKPQLTVGVFKCRSCDEIISIPQGEYYTKPYQCPNNACNRKGPFTFIAQDSQFIDWQKIRIQEKPEELPAGQLPRSLDAYLKEDLVDTVRPGNRITGVGILYSAQDKGMRGNLKTFHIFLEINSIDTSEIDTERLEVTAEEKERIKELAQDEWIHRKIIHSIAPSIYGYENVKEALALQLFGGVSREQKDGTKFRGEMHVLLVGDPGTGKSMILQYISKIAPRGLYTSGKGTTAVGLTAAVLRDKETGDFTLEAGALVLADRGIACLDEFDKMDPSDRVAIHEGMEQRTISIAKAGIVATLNSRTSILAAANPTFGRYDEYKNVAENIKKLPVTILSRFDVIFIMKDRPEAEKDSKMADRIIENITEEVEPPIEASLLRKYIHYARERSSPNLAPAAASRLKNFYIEKRSAGDQRDAPVPITARQLGALIRLAQAHARMALRSEVNIEDAEASIRLLEYSLRQVGTDQETGMPDIDTILTGQSTSQRNRLETLHDLINEMTRQAGGAVLIEDVIEEGGRRNLQRAYIERAIEQLTAEGLLYRPEPGRIRPVD